MTKAELMKHMCGLELRTECEKDEMAFTVSDIKVQSRHNRVLFYDESNRCRMFLSQSQTQKLVERGKITVDIYLVRESLTVTLR